VRSPARGGNERAALRPLRSDGRCAVIVPAGAVVVDAEIVGIVCTALVRHVQAERIGDPAVLRLLDELRTVADRPADGG
jgi:hypothetical protein